MFVENKLAFKEQKVRNTRGKNLWRGYNLTFSPIRTEKTEWNGWQCYYNLENVVEDSQFSVKIVI